MTLLTLIFSYLSLNSYAKDWSDFARQFTGESEMARSEAIREIQKTPHLVETLRQALLTDKKYLALDVISTLKLHSFLPELIENSIRDESGYFYHVINSLVTPENRIEIAQIYQKRISEKSISPASKIALIDTLARFGAHVETSILVALLNDPFFEVQSATLNYIRFQILKLNQMDCLPLLKSILKKNGFFQIKLQTLYLISELSPRKQREFKPFIFQCSKDNNFELKQFADMFLRKINP